MTSGTAAAGFAARQVWQLENGSGTTFPFGQQDVEIVTATAGAEDGKWRWWLAVASALVDLMTLSQNGNLTLLLGDYVWQSGTANTGTLTHANTGNRSYAFPDESGDMVYKTVAALTASRILLGDGTAKAKILGSLGTTTTLLHGNAAGDPTFGAVDLAADVTGTLPAANGGTAVTYDRIAATVALTGQTTTIGPTTIASAGSQFLLTYTLLDTAADVTAGAVQLTVNYTDDAGATVQASASVALTALGRTSGLFSIQRASGNITYTVTLTGIIGTATYAIYATLLRLS